MDCTTRPECQRCGLHTGCLSPAILGRGAEPAAIMFLGEAPGRDEDEVSRCFVGMSGYLLDLAIQTYELPEDQIFRTNVVKCRPRDNKLLQAKKRIECCAGLLLDEIDRVRPRILVPLGATATSALLGEGKITLLHGRALEQDGFLILPMYHPAAVIRDPTKQGGFDHDFSILRRLFLYGKVEPDPVDDGLVTDFDVVIDLIGQCLDRGYTCIDYETNCLKPWEHPDPRIGLVSLSLGTHKGRAFPLDDWQSPWKTPWTPEQRATIVEALRILLTDPAVDVVAHNAKYETMMTQVCLGFRPKPLRCSMIAHSHIDENAYHNLDDLAWRWTDLGGYKDDFKQHLADPDNYLSATLEQLASYGSRDVMVGERVDRAFLERLSPEQRKILQLQEELIPVLTQVELRGKAVDEAALANLDVVYTQTADAIEVEMRAWPEVEVAELVLAQQRAEKTVEKIREEMAELQSRPLQTAQSRKAAAWRAETIAKIEAGDPDSLVPYWEPFNFRSDPQMQALILDPRCFGWQPTRFTTDSGAPSIGKDSLVVWGRFDPRAQVYRRYRRIRHSHSQFIAPMYDYVGNAKDRRVHASYNQAVARTGRLSCSDPNEQNRIRDDTCKVLGVPPLQTAMYCSRWPDGEIVKGDYSQLELRVLASASQDTRLIEAYQRGWDLHAVTTLRFFHDLPDGCDDAAYQACLKIAAQDAVRWKIERSIGKRCNFLTGYGGSGLRLQALLAEQGIYLSEEECDRYVELFFEVYPGVRIYMDGVVMAAKANGGNCLAGDGRVRHLPALLAGSPGDMAEAARQAGNHTIQWPAAKLTMLALIRLEARLEQEQMGTLVIGSIHDSIILDSPAGEQDRARELLKAEMEGAALDPRWMPAGWLDPRIQILADVE